MYLKWSSLIVTLLFFSAIPVYAHQIKSDGNMSVLLHSDPNDDPYAGAPAVLYFAFTDKSHLFQMESCDCMAYVAPYGDLDQIEEKGVRVNLGSPQITQVHGSYSFEYVFPRRDIYAVVVEGAPREGASFEPFRIEYALRIAKGENLPTLINDSFLNRSLFSIATLTTLTLISALIVGILIQRRIFKK